ncbi:DNA alkylation repair protein [Gammaproteobacteria bacterium]|nr:DNA alkylation repair protein [Gammaproteobacteria bacterium]
MSLVTTSRSVVRALKQSASIKDATAASRFIKTGKGRYGEGDSFLGIRMPVLRQRANEFKDLSRSETSNLLKSKFHEARITALLIMVLQFQHGDEKVQARIVQLYLNNTLYVNGWDLVDCSAHLILGPWLMRRDKGILSTLARSESLWERRIAIMSTFHFIRQQHFSPTLKIARLLLKDNEDLIHKAVGWMLREVGNRDRNTEEEFLRKYYRNMPRTMLRYAIEKFPEARRQQYLNGTV